MRRGVLLVPALLAVLGAVACGGSSSDPARPGPRTTPARGAEPALVQRPPREGEVLVRGDLSPASHGPYTLRGAYRARFEQYAPEDPRLDFSAHTAFVASLDRRREEQGPDSVRLFRLAARTGERRVRLDGRFFLDVVFGDFPYVVRLTPER